MKISGQYSEICFHKTIITKILHFNAWHCCQTIEIIYRYNNVNMIYLQYDISNILFSRRRGRIKKEDSTRKAQFSSQ